MIKKDKNQAAFEKAIADQAKAIHEAMKAKREAEKTNPDQPKPIRRRDR